MEELKDKKGILKAEKLLK